jgi:hypothetical protein
LSKTEPSGIRKSSTPKMPPPESDAMAADAIFDAKASAASSMLAGTSTVCSCESIAVISTTG